VFYVENKTKEVIFVSGYLGGYPGTDREQDYVLFAKLYNEGYTHVEGGDEGAIWVAKEPLPQHPTVEYYGNTVNHEDTIQQLQDKGWTVLDLEDDRPDLLPEQNHVQKIYSKTGE
jgi:hypothetical protein